MTIAPGAACRQPQDGSIARTSLDDPLHLWYQRAMKSCLSPWRFSVAPMMDWTDRHCRFFHRLMTRRALLYTEMVTTGAVIHGDRVRLLGFSPDEQPVALQLGGSDPRDLAISARIGADEGYSEINLNCGCPSDRVQNGRFGACLMADPALVADCVAAMKSAVSIPVTVKCRIGIDDQNPDEAHFAFAENIIEAGADALIVHARKAWLKGLSPRENRDVPPLDYTLVRRLKVAHPAMPIAINGGIADLDAAELLLAPEGDLPALDGVMLGRAAYQNPGLLCDVDRRLFGAVNPATSPVDALEALMPYLEGVVAAGHSPHAVTRHLMGLFPGLPGARAFRRHLSTEAVKSGSGATVLREAIAHLRLARTEEAA